MPFIGEYSLDYAALVPDLTVPLIAVAVASAVIVIYHYSI